METRPTSPEEQRHRQLSYLLLAVGCILLAVAYLVGVSDNSLGYGLQFLGAFALILGIIYLFGTSGGRTPGQDLLYWVPRVICITAAVILSIFALDAFGEGKGFWSTAVEWLLHLIPNFLILLVLAVSWRREWIGGYFFIALAVLYVVWVRSARAFLPWAAVLSIAVPFVLIGALFLLNWYKRDVLRGSATERATPGWLLPGIVIVGFVIVPVLYFAFLPSTEPVTFLIDAPAAQHVFVAGSFNGWRPRQYPLSRQSEGPWQTTIALPAGRYEYKFIVDTAWIHDVNNPDRVEVQPPGRGYNSVIVVGGRVSTKR